jgi:hypothetical protein
VGQGSVVVFYYVCPIAIALEEDELSETESEANEREEAAAVAELKKRFPDQWTPDLTAEEQAASVRIAEECADRMAVGGTVVNQSNSRPSLHDLLDVWTWYCV